MPTSVALGPHFETFVKEQVASGRYKDASEVIRDGLRLLENSESEPGASSEDLRSAIAQGAEGPFHSAADVFARVRAEIDKVAQGQAKA